jgi:anaerobic dimethyl sulfoxide reductase subunit A
VDALERGIADGAVVELWNNRGRIFIPARVTDNIMRGVLAIAQGAWNEAAAASAAASADIRGNINTLSSSRPSPFANGNTQHSILVGLL